MVLCCIPKVGRIRIDLDGILQSLDGLYLAALENGCKDFVQVYMLMQPSGLLFL